MVNTDWELRDPGMQGNYLTITRSTRGDGTIYFRHLIAKELNLSEHPYCYVHTNGSKMMIAFTQNPLHPGYRRVHPNIIPCISIAGHDLLGKYMKPGEKKTARPKIDNGNIIIDLDKLW